MLDKPLRLGKKVNPYGKICAIHSKGGERNYFLINKHKVVTLMPAEILEPMAKEADNGKV